MQKTALILATALALGAPAAPAFAQEGDSPLKWAARKANMATDPAKPADFVAATRKPDGAYEWLGVGERRPERARKPLDGGGVKTRESGFDALKSRNEKLVAGKPAARPVLTLPPAALKARAEHEAALKARAAAKTN